MNEYGKIEVGVYGKATYSSKYLDFHLHRRAQSKGVVVKALMTVLNAFHQQLHKDRARSDVLSTTLKLING